ncbi:MAG: DNA recombination protein RmuC [Muribaculaceae bacterium]|nr:DNA recombination protein RmuC [Muribaculaceae bacterium]
MTLLYVILAMALGAAIAWLTARNFYLKDVYGLKAKNDVLQTNLHNVREQAERAKEQYKTAIDDLREEHRRDLETQMTLIREQMNAASEKILTQRQEQLKQTNVEQLGAILDPLRDNIKQMREAVEKSDRQQSTTMELLNRHIRENIEASQQVGERADKLAAALTAENKTQGNFGELRLKQLLEDMGFVEGEQFEQQTAMRDEQGNTERNAGGGAIIPDVILHFPDKRDVVIDSKVSLKAFYDYHNAASDDERRDAAARHVQSIRAHINELSRKNYSKYIRDDRKKLDFVFMYVFSDSALQLALNTAPELSRQAYDQGVILAGTQSLYMMLRVLEMTWKQMQQYDNQQAIMRTADEIVERVQIYYERVLEVDKQLQRTASAFADLRNITRADGRSIAKSAGKLLDYGARQSAKHKPLPKSKPENEEE